MSSADAPSTGAVASLWRYPVKSMQGERLDAAELSDLGVVGDRAFAVVDVETGKVASAKHPRKWARLLDCHARFAEPPSDPAALPPVHLTLADGTEVSSDDPAVDDRLSELFGRRVHLAPAAGPAGRTLEEVWPAVDDVAPDSFIADTSIESDDPGETVSDVAMGLAAPPGTFFDLTTLHLLTSASLAHLATLHPESRFDVRRYRPNLVIDIEGSGFVENDWSGLTLRVGAGVEIAVVIPTMRCIMTTLAQGDLPADVEVLRTAARHNHIEIPGLGSWACTGAYANVAAPGSVAVGDPITVGGAPLPA
jgi:uncharacterized protein